MSAGVRVATCLNVKTHLRARFRCHSFIVARSWQRPIHVLVRFACRYVRHGPRTHPELPRHLFAQSTVKAALAQRSDLFGR